MAQVFLDAHPEHVLIKTDFKNSFNLTPRNLMLAGLHNSFCPRLIPWFRRAYREASPLVDGQGRVVGSNELGCRQGDPSLAALLFCVAIQNSFVAATTRLQQEFHATTCSEDDQVAMRELRRPGCVLAYMDDCTVTIPVYLANRVAAKLTGIFWVGLECAEMQLRWSQGCGDQELSV
jgi:hypothetical protein